jgi:hypothetical protein
VIEQVQVDGPVLSVVIEQVQVDGPVCHSKSEDSIFPQTV